MSIEFPEDYPEVVPDITLSSDTGIEEDLLTNEVIVALNNTANDNIGMIMIFQIYSDCKDWVSKNITIIKPINFRNSLRLNIINTSMTMKYRKHCFS